MNIENYKLFPYFESFSEYGNLLIWHFCGSFIIKARVSPSKSVVVYRHMYYKNTTVPDWIHNGKWCEDFKVVIQTINNRIVQDHTDEESMLKNYEGLVTSVPQTLHHP